MQSLMMAQLPIETNQSTILMMKQRLCYHSSQNLGLANFVSNRLAQLRSGPGMSRPHLTVGQSNFFFCEANSSGTSEEMLGHSLERF